MLNVDRIRELAAHSDIPELTHEQARAALTLLGASPGRVPMHLGTRATRREE